MLYIYSYLTNRVPNRIPFGNYLQFSTITFGSRDGTKREVLSQVRSVKVKVRKRDTCYKPEQIQERGGTGGSPVLLRIFVSHTSSVSDPMRLLGDFVDSHRPSSETIRRTSQSQRMLIDEEPPEHNNVRTRVHTCVCVNVSCH